MSRPHLVALLLAALAAPGAAGAQALPPFTRTTTCDNDPAAGQALWWGGSPPAVTWFLYTGSVPPGCGTPAALEALTATSFSTWSNRSCSGATSGFAFLHTSANRTPDPSFGNDGINLVTWRKGLCSALTGSIAASCRAAATCQDQTNCWDEKGTVGSDVLALTWVTFQPSTGQILDADMELNEWNGLGGAASAGYSYTCGPSGGPVCTCTGSGGCASASPSCNWADVGAIVTHEAGHVLGLDHPASGCSPTCAETMAPHIGLGDTSKRFLSTEDVRGVCAIYPSGGAAAQQTLAACTTGSAGTLTRSSRSCGCGGDASGAAWALLGPLLLLRRRTGLSAPGRRRTRPRCGRRR